MKKNQLKKSSKEKSLYGVCGGIAEFFGISSLSIRLIFLVTMPVSIIVYIILVNSLPDSPPSL
ncbi:PspC domain-containing protein [Evansella tamaricis]|uniref:PspC domain-containing protein n=1 Tax=Evansella tamaricis TaxID=2069301 RepID=A0ABS6JFQ1_9BACI|nr:PspC domain-containing protein [Evansella tamaricis]MBU9712495.1 PspC domain-containing protein [Evansella tamaricis]